MIELKRDILAGGDLITLGSLQVRLPDSQHIYIYGILNWIHNCAGHRDLEEIESLGVYTLYRGRHSKLSSLIY